MNSNPTDAPPELLPTIRKRFERALATALNFTGQSAGSPKVMLEISDVHYLLKWLDTAAPAGQEGDCEELRRRDAEDWVETDTAIRELCRPYTDVDGNSYAVPDIVSVVEVAIKKLTARATTPSPAPRIACVNLDCIDGKINIGCAIDKPLLTVNCPDCNPQESSKRPAAKGDPTRFLDRSFTVVENSAQNIRLINRKDPAQALTLPWDDLSPLREIITLVLNDGPMVIGPAPDKGEAIKRAAKKIADDINSIYESAGLQGDPQAEAKTLTFLRNEFAEAEFPG